MPLDSFGFMDDRHAADRLVASIDATGSFACVGLDPRPELLPPSLVAEALAHTHDPRSQVCFAFERFSLALLDAVAGACAAVKPQVACYEAYGSEGWRVLELTVARARELKIPVIVDAKRGDIGSTAVHYHQAILTGPPGLDGVPMAGLHSDWVTANPYLGGDSVLPLVGSPELGKGAFVLVKTSNQGSGDVQDQASEDTTVAHQVASLVERWGQDRIGSSGFSDIGAVVGATYPGEAKSFRLLMPNTMFLVPGYGAQGATAADAVMGATDSGTGIVVNSSRGIIGAWGPAGADRDFAEAARAALDEMNRDLAGAMV